MTGSRWNTLRVVFLSAIAAGAWLSLRGSWPQIVSAIGDISLGRLGAALGLSLVGLAVTGQVWQLALATVSPVPHRGAAQSVFFVGQLGKYIPGSVWSFGAQGVLAARAALGSRPTITAATLYLGVHLSSGLLLAGVVGDSAVMRPWIRVVLVTAGASGLMPVLLSRGGAKMAGSPCSWNRSTSLASLGLMTVVWSSYAGSLTLLAGRGDLKAFFAIMASFAVAFAAGVLVPIAPAGLGAREIVFVTFLAPVLGMAPATALAIVARLVQTVADLIAAATVWVWVRRTYVG